MDRHASSLALYSKIIKRSEIAASLARPDGLAGNT